MTQAPQTPPPAAPAVNPGKGLGIAGMVLGIVAVVLLCLWYVAIPCAVVGLVLSIIGKGKSKAAGAPTGMATAGMVLSIIALVLDVIVGLLLWTFSAGILGFGAKLAEEAAKQGPNQPGNLLDFIRPLL